MSHDTTSRARPAVEALEDRWMPAAPVAPTYVATFTDAVTADNAFTGADGKTYWTVDAGADQYQIDMYERPTAQTFQVVRAADGTERFAASEYFSNLDVVQGRAGFDANFLYISIKVAGLDKLTSGGASREGLVYQYGFRLATNPDGGGGLLVVADQPGLKNAGRYGSESTFVYRDANGDVGGTGLDVTKSDRTAEVSGNGYERVLASDGRTNSGQRVLWVRTSASDPTVVEFALNYRAVGLTADQLRALPFLEFEANKGLKDPANYSWNDEYTKSEAGSPYRATAGDPSKSEFGTQGLGNIYELDTLRGGRITAQLGSLSGFVFVDANGDGRRDAGDTPIPGVVIVLSWIDANGNLQQISTETGADGSYRFDGLEAGEYTIREEQPRGFTDGDDFLGTLGGQQANDEFTVLLALGDIGEDYNFTELVNT